MPLHKTSLYNKVLSQQKSHESNEIFLLWLWKFSAVDLVFYYYLAGVFDIDKTQLELTICPRHRDMFDGTKGFSTTGKLSPTKIPSSRLASPGSMRTGQKELCCLEFMVFALQHSSQRRTRYYPVPDQAAHRFIVFNVSQ